MSNSEERCQCGLTESHITLPKFRCFAESENAVTFRAILSNTPTAMPTEVAAFIMEWLKQGALIAFEFVFISVDGSCQVIISSILDPECNDPVTGSQTTSVVTGAVIGGILLLLVIVAIVCFVVCFWAYRKRSGAFNIAQKRYLSHFSHFDIGSDGG